jgi:hypothetical protein
MSHPLGNERQPMVTLFDITPREQGIAKRFEAMEVSK